MAILRKRNRVDVRGANKRAWIVDHSEHSGNHRNKQLAHGDST